MKPYSLIDEDRFVEISLDEVSTRFMGGANGNEQEERALFKKIFEIYERKEARWFWVWGIYKDNLLCGHFELKETEHTNDNELELVYMIHPDERRKGIVSEILLLLKQKQASWRKRIIATLSNDNIHSIAALEKWGIAKKETLIDFETNKKYLKISLKK